MFEDIKNNQDEEFHTIDHRAFEDDSNNVHQPEPRSIRSDPRILREVMLHHKSVRDEPGSQKVLDKGERIDGTQSGSEGVAEHGSVFGPVHQHRDIDA